MPTAARAPVDESVGAYRDFRIAVSGFYFVKRFT